MCVGFVGISSTLSAQQKYAYVDTEYILEQIPAYQDAQKEIDNLSKGWQEEISAKLEEVDRLYKAYVKDEILLTVDLKTAAILLI